MLHTHSAGLEAIAGLHEPGRALEVELAHLHAPGVHRGPVLGGDAAVALGGDAAAALRAERADADPAQMHGRKCRVGGNLRAGDFPGPRNVLLYTSTFCCT